MVNDIPNENEKNIFGKKSIQKIKLALKNAYKPNKIKKNINLKNMSLGKIRTFILILILFNSNYAYTEDQIVTSPLINLEELEPSFEEVETLDSNDVTKSKLKEKKRKSLNQSISVVKVMGLDKITAKTSLINIKIGETKKYGVLEIKALKCGKIERKQQH